jgi:glycosyltransferase involved in cell wall biosynthesis
MSAPPTVSVLMTAFNRERYVGAAIESVLAQTFGDFELVVVDDCSEDRTVEIARSYERDARVRVVVNDRNLGDYPNRNRAAALARGEFLKYHDSDDLMYPHCLETMVGMLRAAPGAAFGMSTGSSWPGGPCPMLLTPRMSYQREFLGSGLFMCGPSGALFRTTMFSELGGFPDMGAASDYLFWLEACAKVCVALMPADLFWYRVHAGQELQKDSAAQEYAVAAGAAWRALNAAECPLTADEREQAKCNWVFTLVRGAWREVRAGRWGVAAAQLRHAGLGWRDWALYLRAPLRAPHAGTPVDDTGDSVSPTRRAGASSPGAGLVRRP